jgi:hypothetical protein
MDEPSLQAARSVAERRCQPVVQSSAAAVGRHPHTPILDATIQFPAATMLEEAGYMTAAALSPRNPSGEAVTLSSLSSLPPQIQDKILPTHGPLDSECWLWTGAKQSRGYGCVGWQGRVQLAHRVLYELVKGAIPPGFQTDHLCRDKGCVRPEHTELVTAQENLARSDASWVGGERNRIKTHCPAGHAYTGTNLYVRANGYRDCRACRNAGCIWSRANRKASPIMPCTPPALPQPPQDPAR